eukprot:CAMPEP_0206035460 /NCGR_PEP_ID=MMETSP1466-20131121/2091_1 /ASSEMBLY_ACC=CAM_ASM_001126 /TAXON_ID=44452 /ORGANISM="Pavlova gyrans, Strain CCMP608" /LENGTH=39 /DNA_ID= /DNA_START= /DNA_END= /DNA_ORIENTATION=
MTRRLRGTAEAHPGWHRGSEYACLSAAGAHGERAYLSFM